MKYIRYIITAIILMTATGCRNNLTEPGTEQNSTVFQAVDELMSDWYLWNDQLNGNVNYTDYNDPGLLLDALKKDGDNWSYVEEYKVIESLYEDGKNFGYGFYLEWQEKISKYKVIFCYTDTEAYKAGIRRGWTLETADNLDTFHNFYLSDPGTLTFEFTDTEGQSRIITLEKSVFKMNAVFGENIFDENDTKTGYFAYQSFLGYTEDELKETLDRMKEKNVQELIIDLRYNGGGYMSLAEVFANALIPPSTENQLFYATRHNRNQSAYNRAVFLDAAENTLGLERVFFITNKDSASASELLINCLEPHMEVIQIGGTTHGKPYGMYGWTFPENSPEWYIAPVTMKILNADFFGDYESGLEPDLLLTDQINTDWGSRDDPHISQALYYIEHDSFSVPPETESLLFSAETQGSALSVRPFSTTPLLLMNR